MATWGCLDCTTVYAVGAPRCPHCGSTRYEGYPMPKITRHGGPSDATTASEAVVAEPAPAPALEPEPKPEPKPARRRRTQARKED